MQNDCYCGKNDSIILQGFHWKSEEFDWYKILIENASRIQQLQFDTIWLPPATTSADKQGYLPTQWYDLNSNYGSQEELKQAISALRSGPRPVDAIVDIVVNHRCGLGNWADFRNPNFAPEGTTSSDDIRKANQNAVCADDEWAQQGGKPTGANDTGAGFDGGRDLDHTNPLVQQTIIRWLKWLQKEVGFVGWRWDLVTGYHPRFVGIYNDATNPVFSVAEFTDASTAGLVDWINRSFGLPDDENGQPNRTGGKSMVFDFATRALLKKALTEKDFSCLKTEDGKCAGLIGSWPVMAVTFTDNHDTEPANHNDPFPADTIQQAYAYLLTHPGKPCVFWCHLFDWEPFYGETIEKLIDLRRRAALHAQSNVNIIAAQKNLYVAIVDDKIALKLGPDPWSPDSPDWSLQLQAHDLAVWLKT
ncbi:MAG: alpha-amylase [Phycisphaerae bacterium]|nr:alpha-amylase [Phycisphaerae bacterium]